MSSLSSCLQEAEVLIEAFGEELEDIQVGEKRNARQVTNEDNDVETELRRVLAENQGSFVASRSSMKLAHAEIDLRPRDASPLVLLSREDILTELSDLKAQLVSTETSEKCLVERLVQEYSSRYSLCSSSIGKKPDMHQTSAPCVSSNLLQLYSE